MAADRGWRDSPTYWGRGMRAEDFQPKANPELLPMAADRNRDLFTALREHPAAPIPTEQQLDCWASEVAHGLTSVPMVVQQWFRVSRDDAMKILSEVHAEMAVHNGR